MVIAELLRGLHIYQHVNYNNNKEEGHKNRRVMVVIEEAHAFLSKERIKDSVLLEQVATIARRGRKRWLGLTFVTQFPHHLPTEVLQLGKPGSEQKTE